MNSNRDYQTNLDDPYYHEYGYADYPPAYDTHANRYQDGFDSFHSPHPYSFSPSPGMPFLSSNPFFMPPSLEDSVIISLMSVLLPAETNLLVDTLELIDPTVTIDPHTNENHITEIKVTTSVDKLDHICEIVDLLANGMITLRETLLNNRPNRDSTLSPPFTPPPSSQAPPKIPPTTNTTSTDTKSPPSEVIYEPQPQDTSSQHSTDLPPSSSNEDVSLLKVPSQLSVNEEDSQLDYFERPLSLKGQRHVFLYKCRYNELNAILKEYHCWDLQLSGLEDKWPCLVVYKAHTRDEWMKAFRKLQKLECYNFTRKRLMDVTLEDMHVYEEIVQTHSNKYLPFSSFTLSSDACLALCVQSPSSPTNPSISICGLENVVEAVYEECMNYMHYSGYANFRPTDSKSSLMDRKKLSSSSGSFGHLNKLSSGSSLGLNGYRVPSSRSLADHSYSSSAGLNRLSSFNSFSREPNCTLSSSLIILLVPYSFSGNNESYPMFRTDTYSNGPYNNDHYLTMRPSYHSLPTYSSSVYSKDYPDPSYSTSSTNAPSDYSHSYNSMNPYPSLPGRSSFSTYRGPSSGPTGPTGPAGSSSFDYYDCLHPLSMNDSVPYSDSSNSAFYAKNSLYSASPFQQSSVDLHPPSGSDSHETATELHDAQQQEGHGLSLTGPSLYEESTLYPPQPY